MKSFHISEILMQKKTGTFPYLKIMFKKEKEPGSDGARL